MDHIFKGIKKYILFTALLTVFWVTAAGASACSRGDYAGPMETLSIGILINAASAPVEIAVEKGFFRDNGISPGIIRFDTGFHTTDALVRGEIDVAYMSEFAMTRNALNQLPVKVLASDSKYEGVHLVLQKDRGIHSAAGLREKKIGVTMQSINFFYLGRLLEYNGLSIGDVTLVDASRSELAGLFNRKEVDAVMTGQPYLDRIKSQWGDDIIIWPAQGYQASYNLAVAREEWIDRDPGLIERYLKAVDEAENYIINYPEEARAIMQRQLDIDISDIESEWVVTHFGLSLDLSLIAAMNDEARWLIKKGLTPAGKAPDFVEYVYLDGLRAVSPKAVNINR